MMPLSSLMIFIHIVHTITSKLRDKSAISDSVSGRAQRDGYGTNTILLGFDRPSERIQKTAA